MCIIKCQTVKRVFVFVQSQVTGVISQAHLSLPVKYLIREWPSFAMYELRDRYFERAQLPIEVVDTCDTGCGIKMMHYCNFLVSVANCVRDDYTL